MKKKFLTAVAMSNSTARYRKCRAVFPRCKSLLPSPVIKSYPYFTFQLQQLNINVCPLMSLYIYIYIKRGKLYSMKYYNFTYIINKYAKKISERKINLNSSMKKKVLKIIIEKFFYCAINAALLIYKIS